jgi:hypothetical protein
MDPIDSLRSSAFIVGDAFSKRVTNFRDHDLRLLPAYASAQRPMSSAHRRTADEFTPARSKLRARRNDKSPIVFDRAPRCYR